MRSTPCPPRFLRAGTAHASAPGEGNPHGRQGHVRQDRDPTGRPAGPAGIAKTLSEEPEKPVQAALTARTTVSTQLTQAEYAHSPVLTWMRRCGAETGKLVDDIARAYTPVDQTAAVRQVLRGHVARITADRAAARHAPGESPWFRAAADPFLGFQARGPRSGLEIGALRGSAQGRGWGAARAAGGTVPPARHRFLRGARPDGGQARSSLRSLPPLIWILRGLAVSATGMVRVSTPAS